MDTVEKLAGQLMGFWLAITGVAIAFGILYAVGAALRRKKQPPGRADAAGRGT
jgi:hypothetical protein